MKIWNEFTGITTNKIYKLLHNGGKEDKYSITGVLTKCLQSLFSLNGFVIFFVTVKGRKAKTKDPHPAYITA